jgi:hypothetical protein
MVTCITSSTRFEALLSTLTIYKSSPLSAKFTSSNSRYSKLISCEGGMISAKNVYTVTVNFKRLNYEEVILEVILETIKLRFEW